MAEHIYYDGIRWRKEKHRDYYVATNPKITTKRLHVYIWEQYNGPVPKGHVIHHLDENKRNNDISNLVCISRSDHMRYHGSHISEETRKKKSINATISNRNRKGKVKWSEEARKRASESRRGEKNYFYGCHHTEETKQKIKDSWVIRRQKMGLPPK